MSYPPHPIKLPRAYARALQPTATNHQGGCREKMMYNSRPETEEHIKRVQELILEVQKNLIGRARMHDQSKLHTPEKEMFDEWTPKLKELKYGSDEYKHALTQLGPALQHHYENNSHHPEHHEFGIYQMSLLDLLEMLADWKAASERHASGDFFESLQINKSRFDVDDCLASILDITAEELGW
jgi:hypothetical protein